MRNSIEFAGLEKIIFDESGSLRSLASVAGFEAFSFYRGADLRDLDLSNQNLSGLNFQGADLRGANLDGITFTLGAFNGSNLSPKYFQLVDEFDCYVEDVLIGLDMGVNFFGRMRSESLESAIEFTRMSYGRFCERAGINQMTLRRARREQPVASTTLKSICELLIQYRENSEPDDLFSSDHRTLSPATQPFVQLLTLHGESGFRTVTNSEFAGLIESLGYWEGLHSARIGRHGRNR